MMKQRTFKLNEKGKAVVTYNRILPYAETIRMYLDATTGRYVVEWKWDKKVFEK